LNERDRAAKRYFSLVMELNVLFAFLISLSWLIGFALLKTPVVAILSSVFIASIALFLSSLLRFYVDRKYRNVSARRADYILSNAPIYIYKLLSRFLPEWQSIMGTRESGPPYVIFSSSL